MNKAKMLQFLKNLQSFIFLLQTFSFLQLCFSATFTTTPDIITIFNTFHRKLEVNRGWVFFPLWLEFKEKHSFSFFKEAPSVFIQ